MANYPITKDQLINASTDADTLEAVLNDPVDRVNPGHPDGTVTTRLGEVIKTLSKAIQDIVISNPDDAAVQSLMELVRRLFANLDIHPRQPRFSDDQGLLYDFAVVDDGGSISIGTTQGGAISIGKTQIQQTADMRSAMSIADSTGQQAAGIMRDGKLMLGTVYVETAASASTSPYALCIADADGSVALGVTSSGTVEFLGKGDGGGDAAIAVPDYERTDYMHIFSYGQSLGMGGQATPSISTTQPYENVTFASGVLSKGAFSDPVPVDYSAFKPLVEAGNETPVSGTCNGIMSAIRQTGDTSAWSFVGTAPAESARTIEALQPGGQWWNYMMGQISAGVSLSNSLGKSYSVWGMTWTQGEANSNSATTDSYKTLLLALCDAFGPAVQAITRQGFVPPVVSYQIGSHRSYSQDRNSIAIAQWRASLERDGIVLACPMYMLPYQDDYHHLTNDSSLQLGRYYGKALYDTIVLGRKFVPVQPTKILWQGRLIDITYNVPVGSLVADESNVAASPNWGFDIWVNDSGQDNAAISSVSLASGNRVRIVMSRNPTASDRLTYARGRVGDPNSSGPLTGPRGNIRDQAGDAYNYLDSKGVRRYMHNWCIMFEQLYSA